MGMSKFRMRLWHAKFFFPRPWHHCRASYATDYGVHILNEDTSNMPFNCRKNSG